MIKSKRAAMEMSVGTIVTIVLLMSVLILGIFLVQKVFRSGSNAVDNIDAQVENQINKLFAEEGRKIAIYPTSREITIKKGDDPKGFAFSVKNNDVESAEFTYTFEAGDVSKCGSTMTKVKADGFLLGATDSFALGPGNSLDLPRLIRFSIPDTAPPCTIFYNLEIEKDGIPYTGGQVLVNIK